MLQNLKVDIIYHLTNSDFEMEFNMCGCCRMRLLSDKTADRKSLIGALSRAVSRSRIIVVCGPLFSAEGLIATVATAIGSKVTAVDNAAFGINSEETINIISGSTPLVTPEGYFGGCIIESGPQTIILLTENKAFRKSIMQTLIHPYIEEMSLIPVKEKAVQIPESKPEAQPEPAEAIAEELPQESDFEPASMEIVEEQDEAEENAEPTEEPDVQIDEAPAEPQEEASEEAEAEEEPSEETDEVNAEDVTEELSEPEDNDGEEPQVMQETEETVEYIAEVEDEEPSADEHEIPFVFDDINEKAQLQELSEKMVDAYDTMYIEPERPKHSRTDKYAANYTPTEENDSFLSDAEYSSGKRRKHAGAINIPIIILTVILLVIVGLLCYFLIVVPRMQDISTVEYLREIFGTVNNTVYI